MNVNIVSIQTPFYKTGCLQYATLEQTASSPVTVYEVVYICCMLSRCAFLSWVTHRRIARERDKERFGDEGAWEDGGNRNAILLLIKSPSFSHPSPYMHILIKSSSQCLYVWQPDCLSILLSYSHHELLSQAFAQIHLLYFWVCQISASFFFLRLKDCLLVQGTMSDKFSAHIYTQHANAL